MFQVRRQDLKLIKEFDPAEYKNMDECREAAEVFGQHCAQVDDHRRLYAVMVPVTIVEQFPELRVLAIFDHEECTWSTDRYDAELTGVVS